MEPGTVLPKLPEKIQTSLKSVENVVNTRIMEVLQNVQVSAAELLKGKFNLEILNEQQKWHKASD